MLASAPINGNDIKEVKKYLEQLRELNGKRSHIYGRSQYDRIHPTPHE